jgi:hypothetical protein
MFAYRGWQRLSALDRRLARVVPSGLFYNALVTGVRPHAKMTTGAPEGVTVAARSEV